MHLQTFPVYKLLLANHKVFVESLLVQVKYCANVECILINYNFKCSKICELSSYSTEKSSVLLCSCTLQQLLFQTLVLTWWQSCLHGVALLLLSSLCISVALPSVPADGFSNLTCLRRDCVQWDMQHCPKIVLSDCQKCFGQAKIYTSVCVSKQPRIPVYAELFTFFI